ncbi:hypothetical protein SteCoe_6364 [Stentor coeruleus]|uniref:Uncharacterized protein n=1 Tax=Stentor coeruleus TaxID=5963 RepID=A0A1R2CQ20_9CILI|nr:hypothetical protein SteCoe_6364 [Stentor coeruleus]
MESILKGDWTSNDFIEVRAVDTCRARVSNSSKISEHHITVQQKSPSVMKIHIENESHTALYSIEILPKDLLVPLYKQASLLWMKLLFGKALKGETKFTMNYIKYDELKVNSLFLTRGFTPSRTVDEQDAAAIAFEVVYEVENKPVTICVQVPKIMEDGWSEGVAPVELDMWNEPSDLYQKNQKLQEMINTLQQENALTVRNFQKSQQEILNLKQDLQ